MNIGDIVVRFSVWSVRSIFKVHGYVEIVHYFQVVSDGDAKDGFL